MIKIPETIKKRKRIAELTNKEKVELNNFLIDFLRRHENELYQPKGLIDELGLKFLLSSFVTYLRASRQKMGLLRVDKIDKQFYGISTYCGSNECFYDWCTGKYKYCRKGLPNPNLKFYEKNK